MGGGGVNSENSDEEAWDALERRLDDPSSSNHPTTTTYCDDDHSFFPWY